MTDHADLAPGESVVEVPSSLLPELAGHDAAHDAVRRTDRGTILIRGRTLVNAAALRKLNLPAENSVLLNLPANSRQQIEHIAALWSQLSRPTANRFGLTVTTDRQRLWLDTQESAGWWSFTTPPGRVGSP